MVPASVRISAIFSKAARLMRMRIRGPSRAPGASDRTRIASVSSGRSAPVKFDFRFK